MAAAYPRLLLELAAERGIAPEQVLAGTRLTPTQLAAAEARVNSTDAARVAANAMRLTGERGLGLEFGLRTKPTAHGHLGYALMSCGSLREVLQVAMRFVQMRQRDVALNLSHDGAIAVVEFHETHPLGALRQFFYEGLVVGMYRVGAFVLGEPLGGWELWFDWPEPEYFSRYREHLPGVRFGAPAVQIRLPAALLDRRPVMADPGAAGQAVEQCERELALSTRERGNLVQRVKAELARGPNGYPDVATVAGRLFVSDRTLKRRLHESGTSFQDLLDEARHRDAVRLLRNGDLEIQDVAAALGYSDPPSFSRAFRRWTGRSPSAAKRANDGSGTG